MILTFVDAGVLIAAARGGTEQAERALGILEDPSRRFAASSFLMLEVITAVAELALNEASTCGVQAMDALHVAAAALVGAEELVTTERTSRSIHRARSVRIVSINPVP